MRPGKLFWKLFLGTAVLMAAVLGVCTWVIVRQVNKVDVERLTQDLTTEALVLRQAVADRFGLSHRDELERLAREIGQGVGTSKPAGLRVTFILHDPQNEHLDGSVLGDSEADPGGMELHKHRPEVRQALAQGWGEDTRLSHTVSRPMKYVAVRVGPEDAPVGVVRVSMPIRDITERATEMRALIWMIAGIGLAAVVVFALGLAQLWSKPIRRITQAAQSLSRGDLSARARVHGSDEVAVLARSFNEMRDHLAAQLHTIDRQRRTLESLLVQLHEAVVATGPDGCILLINPAACSLLELPDGDGGHLSRFEGRPVEECVPQHELQRMLLPRVGGSVKTPPDGGSEPESGVREVRLRLEGPAGPVCVLARASDILIPGSAGGDDKPAAGRLLVITDVTELTQMLQMKADFAANASHELRTPLSAIRAAVETLIHLDFAQEPDTVHRVVGIIDRQSSRLEAMVADLLDLSRIESSPAQFQPQELNLEELLADLYRRFRERLDAARLYWQVDVDRDVRTIFANPHLLRLILQNLIDNAIKFTAPDGHVRLACRPAATDEGGRRTIAVEVTDDGCGIPEQEQARVFERFYQVEKARSGEGRGTGLGLSIVRHAVAAMDGTVSLQSRPGRGTTVTITFPQGD